MREFTVGPNEAGQRFDKLLAKYLSAAPAGFLYKMMRKKNITLNGKKAAGSELTKEGDQIRFFLADETFEKFSGKRTADFGRPLSKEAVLYEDENICILNKPVGILAQKSRPEDTSINEQFLAYLLQKGEITPESLAGFRPSVCNRLDRNTSGLTLAGKTLAGLQELSKILHDRSLHKYYLCLVKGAVREPARLSGFLVKEEKSNRVFIMRREPGQSDRTPGAGARDIPSGAGMRGGLSGEDEHRPQPIETEYTPLWTDGEVTLLSVLLITGRSHQIRAHLASIGHPILGDRKYGNSSVNARFAQYRLPGQLLHAYRMEFPALDGALQNLSGRTFTAPLPETFGRILRDRGCDFGTSAGQDIKE